MDTNFKDQLNEGQYEAVTTTEGPVLVLAGAGTGKTRVITYRIAYLIKKIGIPAENILAVTFTNKAAEEMKKRLKHLVGNTANDVRMGTFHSICLNILRRDGEKVGLPPFFGIVDQEDRISIIRHVMKGLDIDVKKNPPKQYLNNISSFKNTQNYVDDKAPQDIMYRFVDVYNEYQESLKNQKLIDFDDMLSLTVRLFERNKDTLEEYKDTFKYILVDEYQDTNSVQFKFLFLLSGRKGNICVVGDDDQSIYGWRGAEIRNILEFDKTFDNICEIKLVENYRSGSNILEKANKLIEKNIYRRGKNLKACNKYDSIVEILKMKDDTEEAQFVSDIAAKAESQGKDLSEIAVLYRTNAQSRSFEVALNKRRIAYKVIGGIGFYQRREIKDILSYLRFFDNKYDEASFRRSIKNPPRGLGDAGIDKVIQFSIDNNIDLLQALESVPVSKKIVENIKNYIETIKGLENIELIKDKIDYVITLSEYHDYLKQFEEEDEASRRADNIEELYSAAAAFQDENKKATLSDFLANTALVTSSDEESHGSVKLMTIHAAKGLEFDIVVLTGLEENIFPVGSAIDEDNIEEERRLCYVGITRAKKELYITRTSSRYHFGRRQLSTPSRFLKDMDKDNSEYAYKKNNEYKNNDFFSNNSEPVKISYTQSSSKAKFPISSKVNHAVFGDGVVVGSEGSGTSEKVLVHFKKGGMKKILAGFLKLR